MSANDDTSENGEFNPIESYPKQDPVTPAKSNEDNTRGTNDIFEPSPSVITPNSATPLLDESIASV